MPDNYEQLDNSTDGKIDFEISVILKFQETSFSQLMTQIKNTKYFNRISYHESDSILTSLIKSDTTINGVWKRTNRGYEFEKINNKNEPVSASVDTIERILKFYFVHL